MARHVSIQEIAEELGVSDSTIRRYVRDGRLTAYRVGPRLVRVDADQARAQLLGEPIQATTVA